MAVKSKTQELTWLEAAKHAEEVLVREGLPSPRPPKHLLGKDYDFPTDPATLTSVQLGRLMFQLADLRGYARGLVARYEVVAHELEIVLDYMASLKMRELGATEEFRELPQAARVQSVLRSVAIDGEELLKRLFHRSVEAKAASERLRAQYEIYESHYFALSREQSRREASARAGIPE